uniref:Orf54 protein n=1 Tax=Moineauvirus Sfi21 TaxID=64186 RepID=O21985_9CAUD|nr:orf54 [Moineauvirus Sfi21]
MCQPSLICVIFTSFFLFLIKLLPKLFQKCSKYQCYHHQRLLRYRSKHQLCALLR